MGYWGPPTSSINWCERDYTHTPYIAEFYNTLSNLPIIVLSAWAYVRSTRGPTTQPIQVQHCYLYLLVVFVGSFAFHATLTYAGQIADEFPMIAGVCAYHVALTPPSSSSLPLRLATGTALVIGAIMYLLRASPLPLQISYGTLTVALVVRSVASYSSLPSTGRSLLLAAMAVYGTAFALWLTEQGICEHVREFQFHALWHLLSGSGTLLWIQFLVFRTASPSSLLSLHPSLPYVLVKPSS